MKQIKLRTRLTVGSVILLVAALAACCTLVISASRKAILRSLTGATVQEVQTLADKLVGSIAVDSASSEMVKRAALTNRFRYLAVTSDGKSEYVLQLDQDNLYNNSGINAYYVLNRTGNSEAGYALVCLKGRDYCVAGQKWELLEQFYTVSVVQDITDDMDLVRSLTLRCVLICGAVTLLAAVLTALFLAKALSPVQTLKQGAEAVAAGDYTGRIDLKRRDELGSLAESFNAMAQAVSQHVQQVEATSEERNMLLHALAHEMRTPVTAITGYSYALKAARTSPDQQREAIDFIDFESRRLERLTVKLTQLVGVDDQPLKLSAIPLSQLEQKLEWILRPQAEEAGIHLTFHADIQDSVSGDGDLLLVLLTNLFDNARRAGATRVSVSLGSGQLSVSDNGSGIPKEQLDKIMQPFYQGDASRNQEGFGLGLALCQKIAELHGAHLRVESTPGEGSCFSLDFYNSFTAP